MSKKKWLIVVAAAVALSVMAVGVVLIAVVVVFFVGPRALAGGDGIPIYQTQQTASAHPGFRRTILTSGSVSYVNDYEEYGLQLINKEPTQVIGRRPFGDANICAIPGQPTTAYIAADVGSEMPAYEVFRNIKEPPFNWRTATFREMQITLPLGARTVLRSSDLGLLDAVVRSLREGAPAAPPMPVSTSLARHAILSLYSDQLPGLAFCPSVYFDPGGAIYLSENISVLPSKNTTAVTACWVMADEKLERWLTSH